jgi:2-phosphoglycolate phosphatase
MLEDSIPLPAKPAAILFDLDGTLVDSAADLAWAMDILLARKGKGTLSYPQFRATVSQGSVAMLSNAFELAPSDPEIEMLRPEFLAIYSEHLSSKSECFDQIEEALATIEAKGIPWGIITNKPTALTIPLLDKLNLSSRSGCVVCGDTLEFRKPHPAPMLLACAQLNVVPEKCVYVGDAPRDIEAAQGACMASIAAAWGYLSPGDKPTQWGAAKVIDTSGEFADWVSDYLE